VFRTPWVSVLGFAAISWLLANQAGLLQNLSLSAVSRLFVYGLVCASLPVFRQRESRAVGDVGAARFRAPAGMVLALVGVAASVVLAARMNVREAVTMVGLVVLASAYWFATRRRGGTID
jgi:amino acid transporter